MTWKLPEGAHRPAPSGNLGACSLPASSLAHIPLKTGEARGGAGQQGARVLRQGLCAGAPETLPPLQGQEGQAGPCPLPGTRRFRSLGGRSPRGPEQRAFGDVESGTQTSFVYFRGASLNAGGLFLGMTSLFFAEGLDPTLLLENCVTLSQLTALSVPPFLHWQNGDNNSTHLTGFL